jgi:hypothetical protein
VRWAVTMSNIDELLIRIDDENFDRNVFNIEITKITRLLRDDLDKIDQLLKKSDEQVWRRELYKAYFVYLEGFIYSLKQQLLFHDWYLLPEKQELLLRQIRKVNITENKTVLLPKYYSLSESVRLLFTAYENVIGINIIDNDQTPWNNLGLAIKVRNRIVHPKSSIELNITNQEIQLLNEVNQWFFTTAGKLMHKRYQVELRLIRIMRISARKQFPNHKSK